MKFTTKSQVENARIGSFQSIPSSMRGSTVATVTRVIGLAICLAMTFTLNAAAQQENGELVEFWKGNLDYKGTKLEMGLKIFRIEDGSLTGKFSSYSQGAIDLPVEFEKDGNHYKMKFPAAKLEYSGTLEQSTGKLLGTMTQGGREDELNFTRADFGEAPTYNRPQTPKLPVPYESEEVSYENAKQNTKLAGTLTLPQGDGPFPVAITISGSGGADRDESHFGHKPFLVIADHLARAGIGVLRFDDRGIGKSTGERSGATSADFATDVEAGIEYLKSHPKIDRTRIGLIGHSEGGLIAPMIAAERNDVHFVVLLAGPGVNGGVILNSQSTAMMKAEGKPESVLKANDRIHQVILASLEGNGEMTHDEIKSVSNDFLETIDDKTERQLLEKYAEPLVGILKSPWVRSFVQHKPAKTLAQVKCHVLAMNGQKDLQVLCDLNIDPIEKALQQGSAASFKVVRLPNVNHMFQETNGSGSPDDYGDIEQTFSPKALKIMSSWINKITQ